jgi:hypothetical protein
MNINNRIENKTKVVNGYEFKLVWCEHSNKYKITHNGKIYSNGYKINNLQKALEFIDHITNNKQTYILNK